MHLSRLLFRALVAVYAVLGLGTAAALLAGRSGMDGAVDGVSLLLLATSLALSQLRSPNAQVWRLRVRGGTRPAFISASRPGRIGRPGMVLLLNLFLIFGLSRLRPTTEPVGQAAVTLVAAMVVVGWVWVLLDVPRLALTADGLTVTDWRGRRSYGWDELEVARTWSRDPGQRQLPVPGGVLPLHWAVHPLLLGDAVRWYLDNPQERAAIGTWAGLSSLLGGVGPQPAAVRGA
ncbi:PH domain-containing protein [Catellatospora sp. TT07R-123]|uniref:PH domain-containing protein n=1 Tax=Catellatospora sp. TT07R-123 TaxID=2733863 RepID=UPI001BB33CE1|nr:PH domain-containing protein [Catellatospora sp. TT07R-123]